MFAFLISRAVLLRFEGWSVRPAHLAGLRCRSTALGRSPRPDECSPASLRPLRLLAPLARGARTPKGRKVSRAAAHPPLRSSPHFAPRPLPTHPPSLPFLTSRPRVDSAPQVPRAEWTYEVRRGRPARADGAGRWCGPAHEPRGLRAADVRTNDDERSGVDA